MSKDNYVSQMKARYHLYTVAGKLLVAGKVSIGELEAIESLITSGLDLDISLAMEVIKNLTDGRE